MYRLFRFSQAVHGYTEYAKLSPYFHTVTDKTQKLTTYCKLNIEENLIDIWEIVEANYTFDYKHKNKQSNVFQMLPVVADVDISRLQDRLDAVS